ncbi:hypothetical protein QTH90_13520 [Variovorax sp. J2P1-59]|uniref:hypothetical protein n=1 Tax=Variovorax flavidus TaxID=3053501 RepID=UPI002576CFFD|nr:hypothetical protein [Variovorax sp. J2P1-59]MDM0075414.1 hypothetical protein [Variovorax sp. J2P1-59]
MDLDLLAPRRHLAAVGLLLVWLLSSPGCGGGGDASSSSGAMGASAAASSGDAVSKADALDKEDMLDKAQPGALANARNAALVAFASSMGAASLWSPDSLAALASRDDAWGAAPSAALSYNPGPWLPAMADAGITSVRGFHAAPNANGWAPIAAAGMSAVGILQWSSGPVHTLPVNDLSGWQRYVAAQVRRYKGRVKYWEVWNEPPNFTADQSPVSYAKVVAAAFDAAKAVDPTVQLGLAAKSNHVNYLAETIAAGAAGKYDFVTLHPYEVASLLPQGWEGQFMAIVPRVRRMLQDKDPAKAAVPLWFTEIGFNAASPAASGEGPLRQADMLVRIYTMAFAQGVARTYWFDPSDSEGLTMGLTTADGTKRPAWHALRSLNTYLGARPRYAGWTQPGNAYYGFVFTGPQGVVLSAWSRPGQSTVLTLASDVTVVDPRTGATTTSRTPTLTEAPAIWIAPAGSAQAQQWLSDAAASSGKPFPWNGDHSASASVQLTAGATPEGVFMKDAPAATVVNNVAEFNLEGTTGACFAVDPTFLPLYATTPIRITAVLRGHGHGDPGFNLLYESDAPIASGDVNGLVPSSEGWYRVVGTRFHEKTWTVPNARFVGMFGFNFCLYADGPAHSQFSIRRVTVSR